jgi:transposase InsO family protein
MLRTYWVLVVMDQFTRRIIGFGVHRVDGVTVEWAQGHGNASCVRCVLVPVIGN